jgi:hypothetical protein
MRRADAFQGVRMAMILNLLRRFESGELNQEEAAFDGRILRDAHCAGSSGRGRAALLAAFAEAVRRSTIVGR